MDIHDILYHKMVEGRVRTTPPPPPPCFWALMHLVLGLKDMAQGISPMAQNEKVYMKQLFTYGWPGQV